MQRENGVAAGESGFGKTLGLFSAFFLRIAAQTS
jgi:hypothetical protein